MLHPMLLQDLNHEKLKDFHRSAAKHRLAKEAQLKRRKSRLTLMPVVVGFCRKLSMLFQTKSQRHVSTSIYLNPEQT